MTNFIDTIGNFRPGDSCILQSSNDAPIELDISDCITSIGNLASVHWS